LLQLTRWGGVSRPNFINKKSTKMKKKTHNISKTIDDYIINNELNSRIYEILWCLTDRKSCSKNKLKKDPLDVFNQAYAICQELQKEKHPEQNALQVWEQVRDKNLLCETNIIFSCVYVILFFSLKKNPNMKFFLSRIRQKIDAGYFQEFEPLIREELTCITAQTTDFENLKKQADQIQDLDEKELFLANYITHYKQDHSKGDIVQQVSDEINLIHTIKKLSDTEDEDTERLGLKLSSVLVIGMLKTMGVSRANTDLTRLSEIVATLTGYSYFKIKNELQKKIILTKYHRKQIEDVNKMLAGLNISFSIREGVEY
jgi:hypothetical protein